MTILPKKKQNKSEEECDKKDHSNERYNYVHHSTGGSGASSQLTSGSRVRSSRTDDKRPAPDGEGDLAPIQSSHSKRRHRGTRERDHTGDFSRSLVRSMPKSSIGSPPNPPRDQESDLAIPGCSTEHTSRIHLEGRPNEEEEEDISGYNSGDEYHKPQSHWTDNDWEEKEHTFERIIRKNGFIIKKMCEDGACLFRAVADQVYGDQEMHSQVRKLCMDYMEKNCDYFSQYVTENFADYIQRKRFDHIHGNHIEMQAMSEMFNRPIHLYQYSTEPSNVFQGDGQRTEDEPIRISYHRGVHYNSIVNPYKATIGVGLGLPSFKPGLAEKSLVEKAKRVSEQHELEQAMLEDKIRATDWEATNEAIEEQVARESYLEWLHENELRTRKKTCSSSTMGKFEESGSSSPKSYSPRSASQAKACSPKPNERLSPKLRCNSSELSESSIATSNNITTTISSLPTRSTRSPPRFDLNRPAETSASFLREVPPSILGLKDWDDDEEDIMAQVLAQSQMEYLESLKRSKQRASSPSGSAPSSSNATTSSNDYYLSLPSTSSEHF